MYVHNTVFEGLLQTSSFLPMLLLPLFQHLHPLLGLRFFNVVVLKTDASKTTLDEEMFDCAIWSHKVHIFFTITTLALFMTEDINCISQSPVIPLEEDTLNWKTCLLGKTSNENGHHTTDLLR